MNEPKLKEHLFDALSDESPTGTEESIHSSDFDFDITEDTLKHIFSKSPIKKKLAYILSVFYKSPILIILFSISTDKGVVVSLSILTICWVTD